MFTGISGSYTVAMAPITASSETCGLVSPSGVQAVTGTIFSASDMVQSLGQRAPGQCGATNTGGIFGKPGERVQLAQLWVFLSGGHKLFKRVAQLFDLRRR